MRVADLVECLRKLPADAIVKIPCFPLDPYFDEDGDGGSVVAAASVVKVNTLDGVQCVVVVARL